MDNAAGIYVVTEADVERLENKLSSMAISSSDDTNIRRICGALRKAWKELDELHEYLCEDK